MIFSFDSEEIKEFPQEVRDFLINYATEKIKNDNSSFESGIPKPEFPDPPDTILAPDYTRHERYPLVANENFKWDNLLEALEDDWLLDANGGPNYTILPNGNAEAYWEGYGIIDPNKSKTWPSLFIFCCMFGFGGEFPGMKTARNTTELAKNLKMIGLGSKKMLDTRSLGPLLKSISSEVQLYAAKFLEGPPINHIRWFTLTKSKGEFFFAGKTQELCEKAVGDFVKTRFFMKYKDFIDLKEHTEKMKKLDDTYK